MHSSAASSLVELILNRLKQEDLVVDEREPDLPDALLAARAPGVEHEGGPRRVLRLSEVPAAPQADAVKETISKGLDGHHFAYVGKAPDGGYDPFIFKRSLRASDIEIADDVFLIVRDRAEEYLAKKTVPPPGGAGPTTPPGVVAAFRRSRQEAMGRAVELNRAESP